MRTPNAAAAVGRARRRRAAPRSTATTTAAAVVRDRLSSSILLFFLLLLASWYDGQRGPRAVRRWGCAHALEHDPRRAGVTTKTTTTTTTTNKLRQRFASSGINAAAQESSLSAVMGAVEDRAAIASTRRRGIRHGPTTTRKEHNKPHAIDAISRREEEDVVPSTSAATAAEWVAVLAHSTPNEETPELLEARIKKFLLSASVGRGGGNNANYRRRQLVLDERQQQIYEAEDFTSSDGISVSFAQSNYLGSGYVEFATATSSTPSASYVEWDVDSRGAGGRYSVTFRYAADDPGGRRCGLVVNGYIEGIVDFADTGSWDAWAEETIANVPLARGSNRVRLVSFFGRGPHLDRMVITPKDEDDDGGLKSYPNCGAKFLDWVGDGYCDKDMGATYNTEDCGYDGGDCCQETCDPNNGGPYDCDVALMGCVDPSVVGVGGVVGPKEEEEEVTAPATPTLDGGKNTSQIPPVEEDEEEYYPFDPDDYNGADNGGNGTIGGSPTPKNPAQEEGEEYFGMDQDNATTTATSSPEEAVAVAPIPPEEEEEEFPLADLPPLPPFVDDPSTLCPIGQSAQLGRYRVAPSGTRFSETSYMAHSTQLTPEGHSIVWMGSDGGRDEINAVNLMTGEIIRTFHLNVTVEKQYDWETISLGPCGFSPFSSMGYGVDATQCLYIGNVGNNKSQKCTDRTCKYGRDEVEVYKIVEPRVEPMSLHEKWLLDEQAGDNDDTTTKLNVATLKLNYHNDDLPTNRADCETMFVDWTGDTRGGKPGDIYMVTKWAGRGRTSLQRLVKIPVEVHESLRLNEETTFSLLLAGTPGPSGKVWTEADMSSNGGLIALRTIHGVRYYPRTGDTTVAQALEANVCRYTTRSRDDALPEDYGGDPGEKFEVVTFMQGSRFVVETAECASRKLCTVPITVHELMYQYD